MHNTKVPGCPFCSDRILDSVFAESPHFWAVYNIAPILEGHSLIIPKKHLETIMQLTGEELAEFVVFSRDVARMILKTFQTDAFDLTIQQGVAAGQTIAHLHMHLIPRRTGDLPEPGDWYPELRRRQAEAIDSKERRKLSKTELRHAVERLRATSREIGRSQ